jgi:hypothetical protein
MSLLVLKSEHSGGWQSSSQKSPNAQKGTHQKSQGKTENHQEN